MPVYEYECPACEKVHEVQQRMADDPLTECPECGGPVKKIMSRSSFQLKGGGWYADGYSSTGPEKKKDPASAKPACKTANGKCAKCPAAAAS